MHHDDDGVRPCDPGWKNSDRDDLGRGRFVMEGDREGFKAAVRPEFFEDVLNMIAHGSGADAENIRNTRGALAQRQVLEHVSLPPAQRQCSRNVRNCVRWWRWRGGMLCLGTRSLPGSGQHGMQLIHQLSHGRLLTDIPEQMDKQELILLSGEDGQGADIQPDGFPSFGVRLDIEVAHPAAAAEPVAGSSGTPMAGANIRA